MPVARHGIITVARQGTLPRPYRASGGYGGKRGTNRRWCPNFQQEKNRHGKNVVLQPEFWAIHAEKK